MTTFEKITRREMLKQGGLTLATIVFTITFNSI